MRVLKPVLFFLLLFTIAMKGNAEQYAVNMDKCLNMEDACYAPWKITLNVEQDIEGYFAFDITNFKGGKEVTFYPLVSIFNRTLKPIKVKYGIRLLDAEKQLVIEG